MNEKKKSTQELFDEISEGLIIPLEENEIICPTCKGLRMILKETNEKCYIESCPDCYNGKVYKCKYCGKLNKTDYCHCDKAEDERHIQWEQEQLLKEEKCFKKAKKIKINDYYGYFSLDCDEPVIDKEQLYDYLYDKIKYENATDEDLPKFLWAMTPEPVFDLNLEDIIYDKCEDGYDDMYSNLNVDDEDFRRAQEILDDWYKRQGDSVNMYSEDMTKAVILDDLIKRIRTNIKNEKKE
jgi:hypothetical protein